MKGRADAQPLGRTVAAGLRCASLRLGAGAFLFAASLAAQEPEPPRDTVRRDSMAVRRDTLPARADTSRADSLVSQRRVRGDSIRPRPPISPGHAFLRSLVLPGWGQATLSRNVTGGIFVAFEGIAATMVWKAGWQLNFARVRGKHVKSHIQEQQDWVVLLVFNHLLSATEAFVSAHLYDFPAALNMQTMPDGSPGVGIRVRF